MVAFLFCFSTVHLHNEFLLAIIAKCQSVSSSMGMFQLFCFYMHVIIYGSDDQYWFLKCSFIHLALGRKKKRRDNNGNVSSTYPAAQSQRDEHCKDDNRTYVIYSKIKIVISFIYSYWHNTCTRT